MIQVSLEGNVPGNWDSLQKVYEQYYWALTQWRGPVKICDRDSDCRVHFRLNDVSLQKLGTGVPHLVLLHGSCVIDRPSVLGVLSSLRECDGVIVTCSSDAAIVRSMIKSNAPVVAEIPLAVDSLYPIPNAKEDLLDFFGLRSNMQVVLFIGRLIPHKNAHHVVELLRYLHLGDAPSNKTTAILIGDFWGDYPSGIHGDMYRDYLLRKIDKCGVEKQIIHLKSGLSDCELSLLLSGADVLYHPSITLDENFGLVPVEAMCVGLPVVCLDYGGFKDTVENGVSGLKVPTWLTQTGPRADFRSSYRLAKSVLENTNLRNQLSLNASQRGGSFPRENLASKLYESVIEVRTRFFTGKTKPVVLSNEVPRKQPRGRHFEMDEPNFQDRMLGVREYVSLREPPTLKNCQMVRRHGHQVIREDWIDVTHPHSGYRGHISTNHSRFLNKIGADWQYLENLDAGSQHMADELLAMGLLDATGIEHDGAL